MKKHGVKYFELGFVPHCAGIVFTEKAYLREMSRLNVVEPSEWISHDAKATCHTFVSKNRYNVSLIAIDPTTCGHMSGVQVASTLMHECVHVWQEVLESMREQKASSEIEAYALQYLSQCAMAAYRDYVKKFGVSNADE